MSPIVCREENSEGNVEVEVLLFSRLLNNNDTNGGIESTSMKALLTQAKDPEETCSITLEPIEEPTEIHGFKIEVSPRELFPQHKCIQLSCGHRFNGMAVIIHFARNCMMCPMCRAGLHEPLEFIRSFPLEPWHEIIQNIMGRHQFLRNGIHLDEDESLDDVAEHVTRFLRRVQNHSSRSRSVPLNRRREVMHTFFSNVLNQNVLVYPSESNANNHLASGMDLSDGPVLLFPNTRLNYGHADFMDMTFRPNQAISRDSVLTMDTEFSVFAQLKLFLNEESNVNSEEERPNLTLQCTLQPCRNQRGYTIQPTFARVVSNAINDLNIRSLTADIFAVSNVHTQGVQIATMRRTSISATQREIRADVSPPIYCIQIVLASSESNDMYLNNHNNNHQNNNADIGGGPGEEMMLNLLDFMFLPMPQMNV